MESKKCTKCRKLKPLTEFYKDNRARDGAFSRCKICVCDGHRDNYSENKDSILKQRAEYRHDNKERLREVGKEYYNNNRELIREIRLRYQKKRVLEDPVHRCKKNVKRQLRLALTGKSVYGFQSRMNSIVGLTGAGLINHLHETFELNYGMPRSWIDLKEVQIDHIIPLSTAKTIEDVKELNHYSNLQLLFKEDNQKKGVKVVDRLG